MEYWNTSGENTCHHVTHVTHSKIVINTRYENKVFKNSEVKPKRYTRLWKKTPRNVPQSPSKDSIGRQNNKEKLKQYKYKKE